MSGRPCGYVLRVLHSARDVLADYDIHNVTDKGVAEQGALLVDSKRSYGPQFTGDPRNVGLKAKVAKAIENNEYIGIISDEPDKLVREKHLLPAVDVDTALLGRLLNIAIFFPSTPARSTSRTRPRRA